MKAKKENVRNKSSARRKLIPAISMLTVSAIMLSTATYAWFTMSKEVEVTGLNMQATAGESLEISLGSVSGTTPSADTPSMKNESWKSAIKFSEYYKEIGKLKPASSNSALSIFSVDDKQVYSGGTKVKEDTATLLKNKNDTTKIVKADSTSNASISITSEEGYFVDIPMWIRTPAKSTTTKIKCEAVIKDTAEADKKLKNAVRVAVIPMKSKTVAYDNDAADSELSLSECTSLNYTDASGASTLTALSGSSATIFGLNKETYTSGTGDSGKAISKVVATEYSTSLGDVTGFKTAAATYASLSDANFTEVFELPANTGTSEQYAVEGFVVRIWLEGESKYCSDVTSGQDWNIDLHFTTDTTT